MSRRVAIREGRYHRPRERPELRDRGARVNLAATLLSAAATTPDAPALHGPRGTTSYGELAGLVASVAERLRAEGVSEGDRVALVAPNSVEFAVGYLATLSRGAVSVPLNPAAPAAELDREVAAVEPRAALVAGHDGIAGVPAVALELTGSAAATSGAAPAHRPPTRSPGPTTTSPCCCSPPGPRVRRGPRC